MSPRSSWARMLAPEETTPRRDLVHTRSGDGQTWVRTQDDLLPRAIGRDVVLAAVRRVLGQPVLRPRIGARGMALGLGRVEEEVREDVDLRRHRAGERVREADGAIVDDVDLVGIGEADQAVDARDVRLRRERAVLRPLDVRGRHAPAAGEARVPAQLQRPDSPVPAARPRLGEDGHERLGVADPGAAQPSDAVVQREGIDVLQDHDPDRVEGGIVEVPAADVAGNADLQRSAAREGGCASHAARERRGREREREAEATAEIQGIATGQGAVGPVLVLGHPGLLSRGRRYSVESIARTAPRPAGLTFARGRRDRRPCAGPAARRGPRDPPGARRCRRGPRCRAPASRRRRARARTR